MMEIKLIIPDYSETTGLKLDWEDGFSIETKVYSDRIEIIGNKEGLISLAKQLLSLAQNNIPMGYHLHFDEYNSLEGGSTELIIQKK